MRLEDRLRQRREQAEFRRREAVRLWREGFNTVQIADQLGVARKTVSEYLSAVDFPNPEADAIIADCMRRLGITGTPDPEGIS